MNTTATARDLIALSLISALEAANFKATRVGNRVEVTHGVVGSIATLSVSNVYDSTSGVVGSVDLSPRASCANDSTYRVKSNVVNVDGVVRRVRALLPETAAWKARKAAAHAREVADRAIEDALPTLPDSVKGTVEVYNSLIDIKLIDLPADVARKVLELLAQETA